MINLRYHIVSITAVFLALGIGLLFGASFIDRATVEVLNDNLNAIEDQNTALEAENARLGDRLAAAEDEEQAMVELGLAQLVAGRLEGVPVVVLTVDGVDTETVTRTTQTLAAAGAQLGGVLRLTDRLQLDDEAEVTDLGDALQLNVAEPQRLRLSLARRLGDLLAEAAAPAPAGETPTEEPVETTAPTEIPPVVPTPEPEVLAALRSAGFVELDPPVLPPAGFAVVPAAGLRLVVVSGEGAVVADADLLDPLLAEFTEDVVPLAGGPVVVAGQPGPDGDDIPAAERVAFVGPLRTSDPIRERLSTVDDLERFAGQLALVLALEHGAAGQFGHYGIGEGAQSLLPPAPPPEGG